MAGRPEVHPPGGESFARSAKRVRGPRRGDRRYDGSGGHPRTPIKTLMRLASTRRSRDLPACTSTPPRCRHRLLRRRTRVLRLFNDSHLRPRPAHVPTVGRHRTPPAAAGAEHPGRRSARRADGTLRRPPLPSGQQAPPQQGGQRPAVGRVRADVDPEQDGQDEGRRAGGYRDQRQRRRQVVDQVRQQRGNQSGTEQLRRPSRTGRDARAAAPRPCRVTASTMTARASTNRQKPGLASRTSWIGCTSPWRAGAAEQQRAAQRRPGRRDQRT